MRQEFIKKIVFWKSKGKGSLGDLCVDGKLVLTEYETDMLWWIDWIYVVQSMIYGGLLWTR
jgi:hypothetical protein